MEQQSIQITGYRFRLETRADRRSSLALRVIAALLIAHFTSAKLPAAERPNVLLIMVDDMGFSDPGCYGGEVDTPHLDALAAGGLRFTQFYNTARCWPTRAALMTGRYPHQAGHAMMYGAGAPPAYQGTSRARGLLISEMLGQAGYRNYHVGKWHLHSRNAAAERPTLTRQTPGYDASWPLHRGFDRSYCVRTQNNFFNPNLMLDEARPVKRPGSNGDYYITEAFTDRTITYLKEHAREHADEPFFLYLAHTAPHFPLHALPEDIERHRDRYRKGWDAIRRERLARQKQLGLLDCELSPRDELAVAWDSLTPQQQDDWATRMAIHAAMVHCVDRGIGRIVEQLKKMDAYDDTLILFLSDNGASAEYIVRGDGHDPNASPGSGETYLCLEVAWSNASNTPFRQHKMWTHEGGISTPLIAHWPNGVAKSQRGQFTEQVGHVIDVVPTILEVAQATTPKELDGIAAPPVTGRSLAPILSGKQREPHEFLFWEHTGNKAIRSGDWKLVGEDGGEWELYNLKADRSELHNLATEQPQRVADLAKLWQAYADKTGVVPWHDLPQSKGSPSAEYRKK
jgi:arylsulfatase A-like enzyme